MVDCELPHDERLAWWNPLNWPAGIWVLIIGSLIMSLPFIIRTVMLSGVSEMPEPFDVAEFAKWNVPDEDNAFTDYSLAVETKAKLGTIATPPSFDAVMNDGWSKSDEELLTWMQMHRESLDVWRRGTTKQKGRYVSPLDMSFGTLLPVIQEQRMFARLAVLEGYRCLEKGELDDAYQWGRAIFRAGGHTTYRGCLIQGLVGVALHSMASNSLQQWAEHPQVTLTQLTSALAAVRADEALYEPTSSILKAEYMTVENTLASGKWGEVMDQSGGPNSGFVWMAMKSGAWVIGEPDLMRRLYRQMVANHLREIDKPMAKRTKLVGSAGLFLFDIDPAVPLLRGQMNPQDIDQQSKRSILMRLLSPAMKNADEAFLRRRARQSALEILLAVQAYQRDNGQYPSELADVVPKYLDQVPLDAFDRSGGTMRYRRDEAGGAVVWSIGPDGVDGNGDVVTKTAQPPDVGFVIKQRSEQ
ncbi:MAG: hypothetical protein WCJ09_20470 [Planctomycetota bacterium]